MEAMIRNIFNLGSEKVDRMWTRMTEVFFTAFIVILCGTPILAHFHWGGIILVLMLGFFISWLVVVFQLKADAGVLGVSYLYGIPAEGDAGGYAMKAISTYARLAFLVLIWAEIYMATYFHLPSLANEWSMIGSAIALMLVIIPLIIYALATGKMVEGPWHKPVIKVCLVFIALIIFSAFPSTLLTSVGINPSTFRATDTARTAQEIREKSFKNLDVKKSEQMKSLMKRVEGGEVLSEEEYQKIAALEKDVEKGIPKIPDSRIIATVKSSSSGMAGYFENMGTPMKLVVLVCGLVVIYGLYSIFGNTAVVTSSGATATNPRMTSTVKVRRPIPWFRLILVALALYYAYGHRYEIEAWFNGSDEPAVVSAMGAQQTLAQNLPRRSFFYHSDWGNVGAQKMTSDTLLRNLEPVYAIEKGQINGDRPIPILDMTGGYVHYLIIEPDESDDRRDIIIKNVEECHETFGDGSWGCATSWYNRADNNAKGVAYFVVKNGVRTIELHDQNDTPKISFRIVKKS